MTDSVSSASINSAEMSSGDSLDFCDISVNVLVRSTKVRRPSDADSRRIDKCGGDLPVVAVGGGEDGGEKDGMCGALSETAGFDGFSDP